MSAPKLADALASAHVVFDKAMLEAAIARMAGEIRPAYADGEVPLYITVMNGGMPFAAQLAFALGELGLRPWQPHPGELAILGAVIVIGAAAALIPALRVFRIDLAATLAKAN